MSEFGEKLYEIRKKRKMSRDYLAKISGVSRASIQRYETSDALPTKKTFNKLINALNLTLSEENDLRAAFLLSPYPKFETVKEQLAYLVAKSENRGEGFDLQKFAAPIDKNEIIKKLDLLNESGLEKADAYIDDLTKIEAYTDK